MTGPKRSLIVLSLILYAATRVSIADDAPKPADLGAAARALDERAQAWLDFDGAFRGKGSSRTTCISCHSVLPYALARPVLRREIGEEKPGQVEAKVFDQVRTRVANWGRLDDPEWGLYYTHTAAKKRESRGTEAVLNALVLAAADRADGRPAVSPPTARALEILWETQAREGPEAGSWDWLSFGLQPWEGDDSRYFGATLAALAAGLAPGDRAVSAPREPLDRLRGYLARGREDQSLFNQVALLRASGSLDGLLKASERSEIIDLIRKARVADGGWNLFALGPYERSDGTKPLPDVSDAYATGLVVSALIAAGVPADDPAVVGASAWLRGHQAASGGWGAVSVNKQRDLTSHVGKFMSDAATGQAVLALTSGPRTPGASGPGPGSPGRGRPSGESGATR